jgi:TRAP-type C4-dicarboxylate transport system permease small subunit
MLRLLDALEMALKLTVGLLIAIVVGLTAYGVPMRYIFLRPQAWAMEISRFGFPWLVMLGAAVIVRQKAHISITFFLDRMPPALRFCWNLLLHVGMLAFCWVLVQQGCAIYPVVAEARSPTLSWSMGWLYLSVPVGGALMGLFLLERLVGLFAERGWRKPPEREAAC